MLWTTWLFKHTGQAKPSDACLQCQLRKEDFEFDSSLDHILRFCLNKTKQTRKQETVQNAGEGSLGRIKGKEAGPGGKGAPAQCTQVSSKDIQKTEGSLQVGDPAPTA